MKRIVASVVVLALVLSGCGGEKEKSAQPQSAGGAGSGNPLTAPVDYLGAVVNARNQAQKTIDLTQVVQAIRLFQAGEERLPKDLQELVTQGYLPQLPQVPKGMRFSYNPRTGQVALEAAPAAGAPAANAKAPGR